MRHARVYYVRPATELSRRTITLFALITGLVALTVAVIVFRPDRAFSQEGSPHVIAGDPSPEATPSDDATTPTRAHPRLGVFLGTNVSEVTKFQKWLGRPVKDVVDFSPRESWDNISNPDLSVWAKTDYRLVYAVPMLPNELEPTKEDAMRAGARGEFDHYFRSMAKKLVKNHKGNSVLRIGWEFNLPSWPWGIKSSATYRKFFRHVVTAVRSVPGAKFTIDWNVNNGYNPFDGMKYYPGDKYVDTVGVDVYDLDGTVYPYPKKCKLACRETLQARAWNEVIYGGPRGLQFWTDFAAKHEKPIGLPEWGLWDRSDDHSGGGDNPFFVQQMHDYITAPVNNVAYASYFGLDGDDGLHSVQHSFPVGGKHFRKLFGD
jgi:hypothetical protein